MHRWSPSHMCQLAPRHLENLQSETKQIINHVATMWSLQNRYTVYWIILLTSDSYWDTFFIKLIFSTLWVSDTIHLFSRYHPEKMVTRSSKKYLSVLKHFLHFFTYLRVIFAVQGLYRVTVNDNIYDVPT